MLIELFCPLHFWSTRHYGSLSSQSYSVFRSTSLLVPPTCFGPPHMCAVCVNFKDRAWSSAQIRFKGNLKASVLLVEPAWLWRRYELEKGLRAFWCMTRCACCQFREEKNSHSLQLIHINLNMRSGPHCCLQSALCHPFPTKDGDPPSTSTMTGFKSYRQLQVPQP